MLRLCHAMLCCAGAVLCCAVPCCAVPVLTFVAAELYHAGPCLALLTAVLIERAIDCTHTGTSSASYQGEASLGPSDWHCPLIPNPPAPPPLNPHPPFPFLSPMGILLAVQGASGPLHLRHGQCYKPDRVAWSGRKT